MTSWPIPPFERIELSQCALRRNIGGSPKLGRGPIPIELSQTRKAGIANSGGTCGRGRGPGEGAACQINASPSLTRLGVYDDQRHRKHWRGDQRSARCTAFANDSSAKRAGGGVIPRAV